jgi:hypothetical protein
MPMNTKGHTAVRARKRQRVNDGEPWRKFELFPTPPFATRALFENVFPALGLGPRIATAWEPCAGLRHMADVLEEYAERVRASDIFLYDESLRVEKLDFVNGPESFFAIRSFDGWIITNPPFALAADILLRAQSVVREGGVCLLLRLQWLESEDRFERVFDHEPPTLLAPFAERVAMCEGGYDPQCSTATSYAWFVWSIRGGAVQRPFSQGRFFPTFIIPPGRKEALARPQDKKLAARHVLGWVPPSTLRKSGKDQLQIPFGGGAA